MRKKILVKTEIYNMKHFFSIKAVMNRKVLTICARSHKKKHSVKILSKFVKKCGRSCVLKNGM